MTSSSSSPTRQALPVDQAQAQAEVEFYVARLELAEVKFQVALRELKLAHNELYIVRKISEGEFDDAAPNGYVMSSRGPWCLGDQR